MIAAAPMRTARWRLAALALLAAASGAWASPADGGLGVADVAPPAAPPTAPRAEPAPPPRAWDAAVGLALSYGPNHAGAAGSGAGLAPAFHLRWGRWSLSDGGGSAFARRREASPSGGLGVEIGGGPRWRATLSLRQDSGRRESADPGLAGLGDVRSTLRARAALSYRWADGWRLGASWAVDALGRDGGGLGELSLSREIPFGPQTTLSWSASAGFADARHLRTWYGVDAAQSARSGLPVYTPGAGWRDLRAGVGLRRDLGHHWVWIAGIGVTHLIGPAADSPIVREPTGLGLRTGLAWRF